MMPSRYTSPMSLADAQAQAEQLGVKYSVLSIENMFEATLATLNEEPAGLADTTEENIQSRCRMLDPRVSPTDRAHAAHHRQQDEMAGLATL